MQWMYRSMWVQKIEISWTNSLILWIVCPLLFWPALFMIQLDSFEKNSSNVHFYCLFSWLDCLTTFNNFAIKDFLQYSHVSLLNVFFRQYTFSLSFSLKSMHRWTVKVPYCIREHHYVYQIISKKWLWQKIWKIVDRE